MKSSDDEETPTSRMMEENGDESLDFSSSHSQASVREDLESTFGLNTTKLPFPLDFEVAGPSSSNFKACVNATYTHKHNLVTSLTRLENVCKNNAIKNSDDTLERDNFSSSGQLKLPVESRGVSGAPFLDSGKVRGIANKSYPHTPSAGYEVKTPYDQTFIDDDIETLLSHLFSPDNDKISYPQQFTTGYEIQDISSQTTHGTDNTIINYQSILSSSLPVGFPPPVKQSGTQIHNQDSFMNATFAETTMSTNLSAPALGAEVAAKHMNLQTTNCRPNVSRIEYNRINTTTDVSADSSPWIVEDAEENFEDLRELLDQFGQPPQKKPRLE